MRRTDPRRWTRCGAVEAGIALTLVLAVSLWSPARPGAADTITEGTLDVSDTGAEVNLPVPKFYAVFEHKPTKAKSLYTAGQILVGRGNGAQILRIEKVDGRGIVLRDLRKGPEQRVNIGRAVPTLPELVLTQTSKLSRLLYRSKRVDVIMHPDPVLIALEGSRAVLEIEIVRGGPSTAHGVAQDHPSPSEESLSSPSASQSATVEGIDALPPRRKLDAKVFSEIDVQEVGPDAYVLGAESLKPVFDNVNQMFTDIAPIITPAFSAQAGLSLDITSSVVDGVMNTKGFTVTNPKVAERFGIQVGDTILQINDRAVNSPLSAWSTYQELIIRNPQLSELHVNIQRGRNVVTKSYTIR